MNKLKTTDVGGMPFNLDDLRWTDNAYREAFYGLISAFGITPQDSFKLSGCQVTVVGNDYTTTAGYICLNGEILKVEVQTITKGSVLNTIAFELETSYDVSGLKSFKNGNSFDTYEVRKAVLKEVSLLTNPMAYNAPTIIDVIYTKLALSHNTGWIDAPINAANFTSAVGTWTINEPTTALRYKRNGKTVVLDMAIYSSTTASATTELYIALPAGMTIMQYKLANSVVACNADASALFAVASTVYGNNAIRIYQPDAAVWGDITTLNILGQITFEIA